MYTSIKKVRKTKINEYIYIYTFTVEVNCEVGALVESGCFVAHSVAIEMSSG